MATYIQGLTGNAPQIQQFKPDHNFYQSVLTLKQNQYDQGLQQVSSLYGSALDVELTRSDNKEKKQEFFNQIEGGIKKLAGLDLSLKQNVEQAYGLFNQFLHDESIQHDAWFTKTSNDELAKANAYKNCMNPEECGGMWWEGGEKLIRLSMKAYEDATAEEAMSMLPQEYVPAQNIHKIATDYIKELGIDKTVEYIDDSKTFVVKDKNGEIVNDEIAEVLNGVLWSDPRIQQFYTAQQKLDRLEFVMLNKDKFGSMDVANAAYYGMKQKQIIDGLKLQNQFYEYDIERGNYKDDDEKNIILSTIERNKAKIENIKEKNDVLLSIANAVLKYNEDNSNPLDIDDGTTNTSNDSIKKQIEEYMQLDKGITASLDRINALYEQSISEGIFNPDFSPEQLDFNMANFMFSLFVTDYSPVLSNLWSTHSHKKWGTPLRGGRSGSGNRWREVFTDQNGRRVTVDHIGDYQDNNGKANSSNQTTEDGQTFTVTPKYGGQIKMYQDGGEGDNEYKTESRDLKPYPDSIWGSNIYAPYTNLTKDPSNNFNFINSRLGAFNVRTPSFVEYPSDVPLLNWLTDSHGTEKTNTSTYKDNNTESKNEKDSDEKRLDRFYFEHRCSFAQFKNASAKGIFSTNIFENKASDRVYSELRLNIRDLSSNKSFQKLNLFRTIAQKGFENPNSASNYRNSDIKNGRIDAGNYLLQESQDTYNNVVSMELDKVKQGFMSLSEALEKIGRKEALLPILSATGWNRYFSYDNYFFDVKENQYGFDTIPNYDLPFTQFGLNIDEGLTRDYRDTTYYSQYFPDYKGKSHDQFLNDIINLLAQNNYNDQANFVMQQAFSVSAQLDDYIQLHHNYMRGLLDDMLNMIGDDAKNIPNVYEYFNIPHEKFVNINYGTNGMQGLSEAVYKMDNPYYERPAKVSEDDIYTITEGEFAKYKDACSKFSLLRNFIIYNNFNSWMSDKNPGGLLFSSVKYYGDWILSDDSYAICQYLSDEIDENTGNFKIKEGDADVRRFDGKDYFELTAAELELMHKSVYLSDESDVKNFNDSLEKDREKMQSYFREKGIRYSLNNNGVMTVYADVDGRTATLEIGSYDARAIRKLENKEGFVDFIFNQENDVKITIDDIPSELTLPKEISGHQTQTDPEASVKKMLTKLSDNVLELFTYEQKCFDHEKTAVLGTITDKWSMMIGADERPDFEPYKIFGSSGEGKSNRYQYENQEDVSVVAKTINDAWHGLYSWSLSKNNLRYLDLDDPYNYKTGYGKTYQLNIDYSNVNGKNEFNEDKKLSDDVACNYFVNFINAVMSNDTNGGALPITLIKCYKSKKDDNKDAIVRWPLVSDDKQELINADDDKISYDISGELSKFADYTTGNKFQVYVSPIANNDQRYMGIHIAGFDKDENKGIDYDGLTVYVPVQDVINEKLTHQYRNNIFELCLPGCSQYKVFSSALNGDFVFERKNNKKWYLTTVPRFRDIDISSMFEQLNVGDMRYKKFNLQIGKVPDQIEPSYVQGSNKDLFSDWRNFGIPDADFANMMRLFNARLRYLDESVSVSAIQRLSESYQSHLRNSQNKENK